MGQGLARAALAVSILVSVLGCGSMTTHTRTTGSIAARVSGSRATPSSIVRRDLSRLARAFRGWQVNRIAASSGPEGHLCSSPLAGSSLASIGRVYNYLRHQEVQRQVDAQVEYRAPAKSRAFLTSFAQSHTIRCVRVSTAHYYGHRYHGDVRVRLTPGLPRWFSRALGRQARGYLVAITLPPQHKHSRPLSVYALNFAYQDATDPHVVYRLVVVQLNSAPKTSTLRVIRATG